MRIRGKRDANHSHIVGVFRDMGCSVLDLASVGQGCPDLLIARGGKMRLCEIKDGDKFPSQQKLTEQQARFHAHWNASIAIVHSVEDAIEIANNL